MAVIKIRTGNKDNDVQFIQSDNYLNIVKRLGIPTSPIDSLTAIGDSQYNIIYNTTLNKLRIHNGTVWSTINDVDLTNYYTKNEIDLLLSNLGPGGDSSYTGNIPVILSNGKNTGPYVNGDNFEFNNANVIDLITQLLQEVINPKLVAQTFTLSLPSYSIREVGVTFSGLMTGNFNRGKINGKVVSGIWQETEFQNYLAGEIESYEFDDVVNQNSSSNFSKVLIDGVNTFKGKVNYGIGPQPLNSINGTFGTPLASGSLTDTKNITAIYPYFYGTLLPTQSIDDIDLSTFVKVVATSNGTVSIPYSSVVDKKLVIVIPNTSTIKTKWYVDALNNGNIGGLGDTFSAPYTKNYNSPTFLWVGKDYKVYISDRTSLNTTIELRN